MCVAVLLRCLIRPFKSQVVVEPFNRWLVRTGSGSMSLFQIMNMTKESQYNLTLKSCGEIAVSVVACNNPPFPHLCILACAVNKLVQCFVRSPNLCSRQNWAGDVLPE
eukprot:scaffold240_cov369-Pavlova_lutheri.AAC.27